MLPSLERLSLRPAPVCPTATPSSPSDEAEDRLIEYNRVRIVPIPPDTRGVYAAVQTLFKLVDPSTLHVGKTRNKVTMYNRLKVVGLFELVYNREHPAYKGYAAERDRMEVDRTCNEYDDTFYECVRTEQLEGMGDESGLGPMRNYLNEKYLLHGTPVSSLDAVLRSAIDPSKTTASVYSPKGNVFYQAEDVGKADQYTDSEGTAYRRLNEELGIDTSREMIPRTHYMLITRTLLGCANHIAQENRRTPAPAYKDLKSRNTYTADGMFDHGYDSLIVEHGMMPRGPTSSGRGGSFREFLVQRSEQVLPVMLVAYVRVAQRPTPEYDGQELTCVPKQLIGPWWDIPKLIGQVKNDRASRRRKEASNGLERLVPLFLEYTTVSMTKQGPKGDAFKAVVPLLLHLLDETINASPMPVDDESDFVNGEVIWLNLQIHMITGFLRKIVDAELRYWDRGDNQQLIWLSKKREVDNLVKGLPTSLGTDVLFVLHRLLKPKEASPVNNAAMMYAEAAGLVPRLMGIAKDVVEDKDPKGELALATFGILTLVAAYHPSARAAMRRGDLLDTIIKAVKRLNVDSSIEQLYDDNVGDKLNELLMKLLLQLMNEQAEKHTAAARESAAAVTKAVDAGLIEMLVKTMRRGIGRDVGMEASDAAYRVLAVLIEANDDNPKRFFEAEGVRDFFDTYTEFLDKENFEKDWKALKLLYFAKGFIPHLLDMVAPEASLEAKTLAVLAVWAGPPLHYYNRLRKDFVKRLVDLALANPEKVIRDQVVKIVEVPLLFETLLDYRMDYDPKPWGKWSPHNVEIEKLVRYLLVLHTHTYNRNNRGKIASHWTYANYPQITSHATFGSFLMDQQRKGELFQYDVDRIIHVYDVEGYERNKYGPYPRERYLESIKDEWVKAYRANAAKTPFSGSLEYARNLWPTLSAEQRQVYIDEHEKHRLDQELFSEDLSNAPAPAPAPAADPRARAYKRRVVVSDDDDEDEDEEEEDFLVASD